MSGDLLRAKMKRQIILISALLAVTVSAGWSFDDQQKSISKKESELQGAGDKICFALEIALDKTGKAFEKAGNTTGQALGIAADKTSLALERAGKKIQGWFDDKPNASKQK